MDSQATVSAGAASTAVPEQLVAVYETHAEAEAARRRLIAAGVEPGYLEVLNAAPANEAAREELDPIVAKTFWGRLRELLVIAPAHERHAYEEGLTRGHAILTLSPPPASRARMIELLESTGPIDFNARQHEWRESGWKPEEPVLRGENPPDLTVMTVDTGRVRAYSGVSPAAGDASI